MRRHQILRRKGQIDSDSLLRETFTVEYGREMAVFEIRDTGPGISAADQERVFEPFVRGSSAQADGNGVGYVGVRTRILVVDNEKVDRDMLQNVLDKALENDAGVAAEDFIFRPPKVQDVLARIGRKLGLQWVTADIPVAAPAPVVPPPLLAPGADHLAALDKVIQFGSLRGILNKLAEIERPDAQHGESVRVLHDLARRFQFDAMKEMLGKISDATR